MLHSTLLIVTIYVTIVRLGMIYACEQLVEYELSAATALNIFLALSITLPRYGCKNKICWPIVKFFCCMHQLCNECYSYYSVNWFFFFEGGEAARFKV